MNAWMVLLLIGGGPGCAPAPQTSPAKHVRFVFLAVLEGLYEQNVEPELARGVLQAPAPGLFVAKCPLCDPARAAFQVYAANPRPGGSAYAEGELPAAIRDGWKSPERGARLKALQAFVEGCVERKLARTTMSEADRAAFKAWAADGRKLGMSFKNAGFGDSCPSCEGVNGKK